MESSYNKDSFYFLTEVYILFSAVFVCDDTSLVNTSSAYLDTSVTSDTPETCRCQLTPQRDRIVLSVFLSQNANPTNMSIGERIFTVGSVAFPVETAILITYASSGNSSCVELHEYNGGR